MNWVNRICGLWRARGSHHVIPAPAAVEERDDVAAGAVEALFEAGRTAYREGSYDAAITHLNAALNVFFRHAKAHYYLGLCHSKLNRHEDAADCFLMAVHYRPDFPAAVYHLGLEARRRRDYSDAATHFARAIELKPGFAQAHNNLGYTLTNDLEQYERGAAHVETALQLSPLDPDIQCNYIALLMHRGQPEQAIELCDRLLALHPDLHEARLNRALAALKLGRFTEAWPDYEARKHAQGNYIARDFGALEWNGESLSGKSILVYAEQGIGDQIMFASCLPDLLQHGGRCIVECAPRLESLFRRSFPAATVYASEAGQAAGWRAQSGVPDFQVAIGTLPRYFRAHGANFPRHQGYLAADPARIAYWRQRLETLGPGFKVGISWRGGAASTRRALRSVALREWLPLLRQQGCRYVSLQYGNVKDELAALTGDHAIHVPHWQEAIDNYDETAALVCALDLVISVQTAVAHLAGGLGRPAWVMVPTVPEWRYLQSGDSMPWYPSVRLFRQPHADQWQPVISTVAAELAQISQR